MLFTWLRDRRRARILAEPFPDAWRGYLKSNVPLVALLDTDEQDELHELIQIFVAEKNWVGCGGLSMSDEIKVTIAAQACVLLLGIDHDYFRRVESILVYPSGYRSPEGWAGPDGVIRPDTGRLGEAWYDGPVVLAWESVRAGGQNHRDGRNVVMHEFAHQLDFLDGYSDGTPPLRDADQYRRWQQVMTAAYTQLVHKTQRGEPDVLDSYGATNHAEFFAVVTECYFEKPVRMRREHPDLYEVLVDYYQQDSAGRFDSEEVRPKPTRKRVRKSHRHWWNKGAAYRGSREPTPSPTLVKQAQDWPGWVRFWGFLPGQPRADAMAYLDRHLGVTGMLIVVLAISVLITEFDLQHLAVLVPVCLIAMLCVRSLWLYAAIQWVDRKGFRTGAKPKDEA